MTSCNNDVSTLRMQTHTTYQCWYPKTNGTRICNPREVGTATVATHAMHLAARSERKLDGMHTWWGRRWCSTSITPCRCHSVIVCLLFVGVAPSSSWQCSQPPHMQLEFSRGIRTKYENDNRSGIKIKSTKQTHSVWHQLMRYGTPPSFLPPGATSSTVMMHLFFFCCGVSMGWWQ